MKRARPSLTPQRRGRREEVDEEAAEEVERAAVGGEGEEGEQGEQEQEAEEKEDEVPETAGPSKRPRLTSGAQGYKPGSIIRIRLENFVTYDSAQYLPGPNLNMILGPNGTGKSTLVCAICLGLGGKPNLLGRAKDLKEFVKHGKERATIEIELKGKGPSNLVVTRQFTRDENSSIWIVNGKKTTYQDVLAKMGALDVQVDNLIQFLPQDRVAEFAQMDSAEVLRETQKATGGKEMYDQHQELIKGKEREREMKHGTKDLKTEIEGLERRNAAIEPEVKRQREREKQLEIIELIKKKKPWLEYDDARSSYYTAKTQVEQSQQILDEAMKENEPLMEQLRALEKEQKKAEEAKPRLVQKYKDLYNQIEAKTKDIETQENTLDDIVKEKSAIRKKASERQKKMQVLQNEIAAFRAKLEENRQQGDTTVLQRRLDEKAAAARHFAAQITDIQTEIRLTKDEVKTVIRRIQDNQRRLELLENTTNQRLNNLKQFQKDTYNAVLWLRANKEMFRKTVYEPIVLQINVTDKRFAREIETAIPQQQLFTFVCEDKEDHHKFVQAVSQQQKLRINATTVPDKRLDSYQPPLRNVLNQYKFTGVLMDYIEAPEAIKICLCEFARLHDIPVTKNQVDEELIVKKQEFSTFYSNEYSYRVTRSKYGDRVASTSTRQVKEARNLNSSVDVEKKNSLIQEIAALRAEQANLEAKINQLEEKERDIRAQDEPIRCEKDEIQKEIKKVKEAERAVEGVKLRLEQKERALGDLQEEVAATNIEAEEAKLDKKLQAECIKRAALALGLMNLRVGSCKVQEEKSIATLKIAVLNHKKNEVKQQTEARNAAHAKAMTDLQEAKKEAERAKVTAKRKLEEAKRAGEPTAEQKRRFDDLPKTLVELEAMLEVELARVKLSEGQNAKVIEEYENREKEIEAKRKELDSKQGNMDELKANLAAMEASWKPKLLNLVQRVSASFGEFMKKLKCVGECRVSMDEDYAKWGIQILVKFRDNEALQVLTRDRQSGGERAVSTILYLMALQDMARSPFRVVDEINQGMDPHNERQVHSIIVNTATKENTSQYFLITPKLLPDLEYNEKMKILCIFNGEGQPDNLKWSFDTFYQRMKAGLSSQE